MRGKALLVVGAAVGYVVGTRQGRKGWERLVRLVRTALGSPGVQNGLARAGRSAKESIPVVGGALSSVVGGVAAAGRTAGGRDGADGSDEGRTSDSEAVGG